MMIGPAPMTKMELMSVRLGMKIDHKAPRPLQGERGWGEGEVMTKRHVEIRARAKEMRSEMTPPERALWEIVRAKRLAGVKFVRQAVRPPYIPDFAARSERLIVEL